MATAPIALSRVGLDEGETGRAPLRWLDGCSKRLDGPRGLLPAALSAVAWGQAQICPVVSSHQ
eukprot:2347780-Amphidinium_carterae.1